MKSNGPVKPEHEGNQSAQDEIDRFLQRQNRQARLQTLVSMSLVVLLLLVAAVALSRIDYSRLEQVGLPFKSFILAKIFPPTEQGGKQCDPAMPASGNIYIETPFTDFRDDYPRVEILNRHRYPVVVRIASPDRATTYQTVTVYPDKRVLMVNIPPGTYSVATMVGSVWCNMKEGFRDGTTIHAAQPLELQTGVNQRLIFTASGSAPSNLHMAVETWNPPVVPTMAAQQEAATAAVPEQKAAPSPVSPQPAPAPAAIAPAPQPEPASKPDPEAAPIPVKAEEPETPVPPEAQPTTEAQEAPPLAKPAARQPATEKKKSRSTTAQKSLGQTRRERELEQERCYDYYAKMRDQIVARMQFSPHTGESFREDMRRNEMSYQECLSRISQ